MPVSRMAILMPLPAFAWPPGDALCRAAANGNNREVMKIIKSGVDVDAEGNASMVQTVSRMRMKMGGTQPGLEAEYDSKSDKEPEGLMAAIAPMFKAFVGTPIELTMSPRGQISKVVVVTRL